MGAGSLVKDRITKVPATTTIFRKGVSEPSIMSTLMSFKRKKKEPIIIPTIAAFIPSSER